MPAWPIIMPRRLISRHGFDVPAGRIIVWRRPACSASSPGLCSARRSAAERRPDLSGLRAVGGLFKLRLKACPWASGSFPGAGGHLPYRAPRAIYCMPGLQNPTGAVMPAERRQAIAAILGATASR
jgi:hypothetical protein